MRNAVVLGFVLTAAAIAACSSSSTDGESASEAVSNEFWGNDRVGNMLKALPDGDVCKFPKTYQDIENCFKVGRKCERRDSQEVYVVEEKQSRNVNGQAASTNVTVPRAVVSGCNTEDRSDPKTIENSYSMFVGLFSPNADEDLNGDTILFSPVEVMALDQTTNLYNFYVFSDQGVQRFYRQPDGSVKGRLLSQRGVSQPFTPDEPKRCFACHVNGGPIMNELSDPWTNWVSFKKAFPVSAQLSGTTKDLVSIAVPNAAKGTSSLAGDLEQIVRAAECRYVGGHDCGDTTIDADARNGFGEAVLKGQLEGGIPRLLKSAFCETELHYVSAGQSVPPQVFFDPQAVAAASLPNVPTNGDTSFPFLFPIRSELDKAVELYLVGRRILAPSTVSGIRVIDDENDVFSDTRCGVWKELTAGTLPTQGFQIDRLVRDTIRGHLEPGPKAFPWVATQPARVAYLKALSASSLVQADVQAARGPYLQEVRTRFDKMNQAFTDWTDDRDAIVAKEAARKRKVPGLFPDGSPFPVLEPDAP